VGAVVSGQHPAAFLKLDSAFDQFAALISQLAAGEAGDPTVAYFECPNVCTNSLLVPCGNSP